MLPPAGIACLERLAMNAWCSEHSQSLGQWCLHSSAGYSGRLNACWPTGDPGLPLKEAVDRVERWYAARSRPTIFKPAGLQPELEQELAHRGYRQRTPTIMMTMTLSALPGIGPRIGHETVLTADLTPEFATVFAAAQTDPGDARERTQALVRVPHPRALGLIRDPQGPVAIGAMCVAEGWCGLFAMRTLPRARRQGRARQMVVALLDRAVKDGARAAWLQVEADNAGAISLYEAFGFREAYRYHYWERSWAD